MAIDFLAVGAHPDDIELCCGGTLIKLARQGYQTAAVTLTRGEAGTRGSVEIRRQEFDRAAVIMMTSAHRMLDMPDGAIAETHEHRLKLVRAIRELQPRLVATMHWEARHPDHVHASNLVREASIIAGLKSLDTGQPPWRPYRVIYFPERYEVRPSFIVDISDAFDEKMRAVRAHESQFHGANMAKYGEAQTLLTRPEFLEFIELRARQWGMAIGARYGEAFVIRENLRIDDPIAAFGEWCAHAIP
jgi:bacillithiol biosynthesis deacetylase BshB1